MLPVSQTDRQSVCRVMGPHSGSLLWVAWLFVSQGPLPSEPHRAQDVRECRHFCHGGLCLHMVCTRQSGGQRAPPADRAGDRP